jgi:hypothetical protein
MSATPSAHESGHDTPNTNANVEFKDYLYYAAVQRREEDLAMAPNSEIEKVDHDILGRLDLSMRLSSFLRLVRFQVPSSNPSQRLNFLTMKDGAI